MSGLLQAKTRCWLARLAPALVLLGLVFGPAGTTMLAANPINLSGHWASALDPGGIDLRQAGTSLTGDSLSGIHLSGTVSGLRVSFTFWRGSSYAKASGADRGRGTMTLTPDGRSATVTWHSQDGEGQYNGSFSLVKVGSLAPSSPGPSGVPAPSAHPSAPDASPPTPVPFSVPPTLSSLLASATPLAVAAGANLSLAGLLLSLQTVLTNGAASLGDNLAPAPAQVLGQLGAETLAQYQQISTASGTIAGAVNDLHQIATNVSISTHNGPAGAAMVAQLQAAIAATHPPDFLTTSLHAIENIINALTDPSGLGAGAGTVANPAGDLVSPAEAAATSAQAEAEAALRTQVEALEAMSQQLIQQQRLEQEAIRATQ